MLLAPVPWARCVWGLPFLTVLAPSERYAAKQGRRHKTLTDWSRQALLQVARWLPGRRLIAVADSSFSVVALLRDLAPHLTVVTRLRLDARLYDPPPPHRPRRRGRPPVQGTRQPSLAERLRDRRTCWRRVLIDGWYGHRTRRLDIATGTALWSHRGARMPSDLGVRMRSTGLLMPVGRPDETRAGMHLPDGAPKDRWHGAKPPTG